MFLLWFKDVEVSDVKEFFKKKKIKTTTAGLGTKASLSVGKAITSSALLAKGAFIGSSFFVTLMGAAYASSFLMTSEGAFTIKTIPHVDANGNATVGSISLSETSGFSNPSVKLSGTPIDNMTNITYEWLPLDELDSIDGSHNGENYIAYTFYVKNTGETNISLKGSLEIKHVTMNVDQAVRVMVYRNGNPSIYAREREDGTNEVYPQNVINFADTYLVVMDEIEGFKPQEMIRYTVVVWLEGEDPECVDNVRSGAMKLEMNFQIYE